MSKQKCSACHAKLPLKAEVLAMYESKADKILKSVVNGKTDSRKDHSLITSQTVDQTQQIQIQKDKWSNLGSEKQAERQVTYRFLDPIPANPSSYLGNEKILNSLLNVTSITKDREVIPVCVDGSPLHLIYKMIAAEDKLLDYQKIVPIPGAGHEEMNMLKSYLALTWEIWGKEFSKSHRFTSPNQLKMM